MRAVVTGGAGFIGSHVVDALVARGDDVAVVDSLATGKRENVSEGAMLHVRDIREPLDELFDEIRPEAIFHLAAQADVRVSVERPVEDAEVNVIGTIRVLEAARRHGAQVVFSSTGGAIYGECVEPAREDSPLHPLSPYGTSKLAGEEYLRMSNRLYETKHVCLRFGNVYGPRQDPHGEAGVVAIFLGALQGGEQAQIFGEGTQTRDYVYVGDVARATVSAIGQDGGVFNVGTGRETSVVELYELCRRAAGSEVEAVHAPARLGELQRSFLDPTRAAAELGFMPMVGLEDGLQATWEWVNGSEGLEPRRANRTARGPPARRSRCSRPTLAPRRVRRRSDRRRGAPRAPRHRRRRAGRDDLGSRPARRHRARAGSPRLPPGKPPPTRKRTPVPVAKAPRGRTVVMVLNGNGRTGAAASAASRVRSRGYRIGTVGNAPSTDYARSLVMYKPGFVGEGHRLAKDLGVTQIGPLDGIRADELGRAQLVFILGA